MLLLLFVVGPESFSKQNGRGRGPKNGYATVLDQSSGVEWQSKQECLVAVSDERTIGSAECDTGRD